MLVVGCAGAGSAFRPGGPPASAVIRRCLGERITALRPGVPVLAVPHVVVRVVNDPQRVVLVPALVEGLLEQRQAFARRCRPVVVGEQRANRLAYGNEVPVSPNIPAPMSIRLRSSPVGSITAWRPPRG